MIFQRRGSRDYRDLRRAQMPIASEQDRDPWMLPGILFAAAITIYFLWQFSR